MLEGEPTMTSRRDFARSVAILAVTAPLAQACGSGARPAAPPAPTPEPTPPASPAAQQQEAPPEAAPLMEVIRIRYGSHLSEEQLAAVRRDIEGSLRGAERMRRIPLPNGVEPNFVFRAYRKDG